MGIGKRSDPHHTAPPTASGAVRKAPKCRLPKLEDGRARTCTTMTALVDTTILVYRFDPRFPDKQRVAEELLRQGIADNYIRIPNHAIAPMAPGQALSSVQGNARPSPVPRR